MRWYIPVGNQGENIVRTNIEPSPNSEPLVITRHHIIDWNYHPLYPRSRPNRWWVPVQCKEYKNTDFKATESFKEFSTVLTRCTQCACLYGKFESVVQINMYDHSLYSFRNDHDGCYCLRYGCGYVFLFLCNPQMCLSFVFKPFSFSFFSAGALGKTRANRSSVRQIPG